MGKPIIRIITIESEAESAKRLGFQTDIVPWIYPDQVKDDIVVRWGCGHKYVDRAGRTCEFKNIINTRDAIRTNCNNKLASLQRYKSVIPVPEIFTSKVPDGVLAVYRPITHAAGEGFTVKEGPFDVEDGKYATRFIPTNYEYRIWFANGHTLRARRVSSRDKAKYPCRSKWGYQFCQTVPRALHNKVIAAAKLAGLETGAADILYDDDDNFYLLELNSAPTIDSWRLEEMYQNAILDLAKKKYPMVYKNLDLSCLEEKKEE